MRIVHFSETDLGGGAGFTAYRLHRALVAQGHDSRFLVSRKFSADPTVHEAFSPRLGVVRRLLRERLDRLPLSRYPQTAIMRNNVRDLTYNQMPRFTFDSAWLA